GPSQDDLDGRSSSLGHCVPPMLSYNTGQRDRIREIPDQPIFLYETALQDTSALTTKVCAGGSCCSRGGASPAAAFLGSDAGSFAAFRGEEFWCSSVVVAPTPMRVEAVGEHDVVGVVRVVQHELSQRPEVGFGRVRPRAVGRR